MKPGVRKETDKKRTLRGITKAVSLAAKLSPKSQRKDKGLSNIAELKVCVYKRLRTAISGLLYFTLLEILPCHLIKRTISYVNSVLEIYRPNLVGHLLSCIPIILILLYLFNWRKFLKYAYAQQNEQ